MVSNIFYVHPHLGKMSILTNIFQRGWNHQLGKHLVTPICKPWKGHLEKKSPPVWAHTHHGYLPLTVPGMILQVHSLKLTVRTWKQAGPQEEMSFEATMHLQGQTVSSQEAMLKKMKKQQHAYGSHQKMVLKHEPLVTFWLGSIYICIHIHQEVVSLYLFVMFTSKFWR